MIKLSLKKPLQFLRVRAGSAAAVLVIILARPTLASISWGAGICLLGLLIRAWASGHLQKEKQLAISGPYRYSRNPLYLGNLILGIGIVVGSRSWWVLAVFIAYFAIFYPLVIRREVERLRELFPEQYGEYRKRVPLFFPAFKRLPSTPRRYSWSLYLQNKEYRALVGTVVFWLLLLAKALWLNP